MALVTRLSTASPDTISAMRAPCIPASLGIVAGEDLGPAAPCYIKSSDGKVYMTDATTTGAASAVDGWTLQSYDAGQPVTLYGAGLIFEYAASGLTPGATLYAGATAGRLDTGETTGDTVGVAKAISATHIRVTRAQ